MDPSGQSQAQESQVQVLQEQELQDHEHQVQAAQGQEPSQDQPNQDASEGEETQGQDMQPQEVIPQSIPFQTFPLEIQMAIFKEAIQKPSVHFLFVERRVRGQIWEVKITPVPKGSDTSGYRYLQELSTVCASAHAAVKWATIESRSIKFSLLPNKVDAATDLFVMRFQRHRNVSPRYAYLQDCFWNSMHEIIPPRLNRTAAREKFRNMRKVGVTWRYHHTGSCAREGTVPFKCLRVGHDTHKQFKICPVELAGFFDCFPELETFYIIVYFPFRRYGDLTEDLIQLRDKIIGRVLFPHPLGCSKS